MKYSYAEYVTMFKALSDETRLNIIHILSDGPLCACNILENFNITQPTLSYHMKILTECGLVMAVKNGTWIKYSLTDEKVNALREFFNIKIK